MNLRKYIILKVLFASLPLLACGLLLSSQFLQGGIAAINHVDSTLRDMLERDIVNLEQEVWRLTDMHFADVSKNVENEAKLKTETEKFSLQRRAIEERSAIVNGLVPFSQQLVIALAGQHRSSAEFIHSVLNQTFAGKALSVSYWKDKKQLVDAINSHALSDAYSSSALEVFESGNPDWLEDDHNNRDVVFSLIPIHPAGEGLGVFSLEFDLSESYSHFDNSERLGLSIEASKLQEQRLREAETYKNTLAEKRKAQKQQIVKQTAESLAEGDKTRNSLTLLMGGNMVLLIGLALFLFWWLGTRRISQLITWLTSVTKNNFSELIESNVIQSQEVHLLAMAPSSGSTDESFRSTTEKLPARRVEVRGRDEVGQLGNTINLMLDSLEQTTVSKNLLLLEIEERRKVETNLVENQQRLKTILDAVQAGVILIEITERSMIIVDVNPAAQRMLELDRDRIVGREYCEFITDATGGLCSADDISQPPLSNSQGILCTSTGKEVSIIKTESEITLDGRRHYITSFVDVTELQQARRRMEEAIRTAEHASQVKGQFLANMSHEIRTPLNGVIGMSEMALESELNRDQRQILTTINREANSLLRIVNDILDFSKIEAGRLELEIIPFDPFILCEEVVQSIIFRGEEKGLEIIFFIDPEIPAGLFGDPGRIRQILANLCFNALKFTQHGEIYIKVEIVDKSDDEVRLLFSIRDTGIGIAPEKLEHIFESFTQADASTTRMYGGTGLGTAIAKQLVEMMNGEIGVESELGQGSTFWFSLPMKRSTCQPTTIIHEPPVRGVRVLLVDDSPTNLFILEEYLNSWGCIPQKANNGREALALFLKAESGLTPFDLIITDFFMPEMNGFDFVKAVMAHQLGGKRIPIIVLSSSASSGELKKDWEELAIHSFINKPILRDDLRRVLFSIFVGEELEESLSPAGGEDAQQISGSAERCCRSHKVLLAEDYPTNQLVASNFLTKAGYLFDLAVNGVQALQLFKKHHYDLVLMDIQMPEMDGYGATAAIRAFEEQQPGAVRTPIIAMTAHAMKGYREKCLECGMDDYITKPLQRRELMSLIQKWLLPGKAATTVSSIVPAPIAEKPNSDCPVDWPRLFSEMEGDKDIIREMFTCFRQSLQEQQPRLEQAIARGDSLGIREEAHAIKGGALNVAAFALASSAKELENIGSSGKLENAPAVFEQLATDITRLFEFTSTI